MYMYMCIYIYIYVQENVTVITTIYTVICHNNKAVSNGKAKLRRIFDTQIQISNSFFYKD